MASPPKKAKADGTANSRKACPYGAVCYRKNPMHFKEFSHPGDADHSQDTSAPTAYSYSTVLPVCKYGALCKRKNLLHFAEFSHPTPSTVFGGVAAAGAVPSAVDEGSDTDPCDSEDENSKKDAPAASKDDQNILKRGMSLVKSFSQMTDQERKELIQEAFKAKAELEEELKTAQKEVEEKDKHLHTLHAQLETGSLLMDGEREALEGSETVYFPLAPERNYKEGSAAQTHYRLAESQFYRLLSHPGHRVTKVDYVVTPFLVKRFRAAQEKLKKNRGENFTDPVLGFHGTNENNIVPICETGFKVPGKDGFQHKTDAGFYGAGVYFSEYPSYSLGYINGATKLLLCQVLPGKTFQCSNLILGAKLRAGFDSHMSPNKKELIIFSSHHILPCYIVYFAYVAPGTATPFQYRKARFSKRRRKTPGLHGTDTPKLYSSNLYTTRIVANNAPLTNVFKGTSFKYAGPAADAENLFKLISKHAGKKGTASKFDILVAVPGLSETTSKQVDKALEKDLPVVKEQYVYECIVQKKLLDPDFYLHDLYDQ